MSKIIKRDGSEANFSKMNVYNAISNANNMVRIEDRFTNDEIKAMTKDIENVVKNETHSVNASDIQVMVENAIIKAGKADVAREYITYRYEKELARRKNTTDDELRTLLDGTNEEIIQENANKNPELNSTLRDYMAGIQSKDYSKRYLIPEDIYKAHKDGIGHFHDMDYFAAHEHNCDLLNIEDMLQNGTCINKVKIDKPSTFSTASNITAQIIAQVASSQYGGQTISLAHLAPFVEETRKTFREEHKKLEEKLTKEEFDAFIEEETRKDIYKGCKTLLYQINTLMTVNGQAPFVTVCMYLNEAKNEKEKEDLAIVIEETIKRRMKGVKDETGHYVGIAFPKVIYYLQEDNYKPGTKYYYLTELAAKCTADKQVPDYMSEKVMKELHNGNAFPTMGAAVGKETVTIKIDDEIYYNIQISKAASLVRNKCSRKGEQHGKFTYDVSYRGQCGVYKVTHKPTNKFYIGSSKDIGRRFSEHRTSIKYKGTLGDSYFIGDYDKDNYEFSVLTICDIDSLYETESIVYKKEANDLCVNMKDPIIRGNHGHLNSNKGYHDVPQHYHQFYKKIDDADVQILAGNQFVPIRGVIINNAYTPLKLYKVTHEFGSVTITEDHPLHTQRGRVECANLTTNDSVILCDTKEYSKILNIEEVEKEATYDFETDCDMFNMSGIVSHNCRSTLSDVKVSKDDPWKVVTKGGVPKYYGRFNQGVFTLNLPDIALCSKKDMEKFWLLLDQRMELAHRALRLRHERLRGVKSDVAPILWQHGALARLDKHETIDKLLFNGYSTISVGYMGLHETVYYLTGKNYWEDEDTMKLAQDILNKMNEKCEQWKAVEHIGYSIYGTPAENLVGKFAKALKKRHGIVPGVSDKEFITNSYHIPVWVEMDAFTKLEYESKLQKLSKGGAISYVEMGDLRNNVDAVLSVMEYIYNNIGYAELNGSTDRCQCGFEGRIELIDNGEGKLIWKCPACGNTDKARMTIIRRVCGYLLNSNDCCQARLHDIKNRVEHI
ncbi:MAG: ATP cone domain-containing protein [Paludibacteraceae bacterium]|nr:ATP cone domain-containing protein [Paludibacteraceae bacterium]